MLEKNPEETCAIVVPTLFLQSQFYKAIERAGLRNTSVWVINTFARERRKFSLVIMDEVHLFLNEHAALFPRIFELCEAKWRLGLSATLTNEEQQRLADLGMPVCDTVSLQEAQERGWVAKCKTYNLGIPLTPSERAEYTRHNDIFQSTFARFSHDFALAMSCVADREARLRYATRMGWTEEKGKEDRWSPQVLGSAANQWLRATHARQEVVNLAAGKLSAAEHLCRTFPVKTLCFSESTAFATALAQRMPDIARAYHSQLQSERRTYTVTKTYKTKPDVVLTKTKSVGPDTLRKEALAAFASPDSNIRVCSAAKALDQGADFPGLQLGVETSGNSSIRQKVQRTGRVVRTEVGSLESKLAVYVHIYALNSYEENKLRRKQRGIPDIIYTTDIRTITI